MDIKTSTATIGELASEFARLDIEGAEGYVAHEGDSDDWPVVGFAGDHAVISVHPDDIGAAIAALRRFDDGAANATGPASWAYDPRAALADAGVRCKWHI